MGDTAPELVGDAAAAVRHRGSHLQIIASAGSGKTEVVAQRVASLLADGVPAEGIVAFTFTERAAAELKSRIAARVEQRLGATHLDQLGSLFVGTIHSYCFRMLQLHVPRYETFDVLDDNRLAAFLSREATQIGLKRLTGALYTSMRQFVANLDVVENELIPTARLTDPFREIVENFRSRLDQYRLLTYGQQIARAVDSLRDPDVADEVHATLRHLIVDEYQDVNPAQEELIRLLTGPDIELCVVGDDDQSIYQWRGSDVANIVTFAERYPNVARFSVTTNRRSRPEIVGSADAFATSIAGRLPKSMTAHRDGAPPELVTWIAPTEAEEAQTIAATIRRLHDERALPYRDIAVLVRTRTAYPALLRAFHDYGVPVQPGGRTGLFEQAEAQLFGRTYAWLADCDWRVGPYARGGVQTTVGQLTNDYATLYAQDQQTRARVRRRLDEWKSLVPSEDKPVDLVRDFYQLLGLLGIADWDHDDPVTVGRLGTLARCTMILADYESVRRRSRPDVSNPGQQVGGQDRGKWYYFNLATHLVNWANGSYEGFDGEQDLAIDAVDVTTVHKAKGLEWPVVFVPSVTGQRFPSSNNGRAGIWHVPRDLFDPLRYEGTDTDERRLFYVAMTRARDWLSLSGHERVTKNRVRPSPYLLEVGGGSVDVASSLPLPRHVERRSHDTDDLPLEITFSELASYRSCGTAYRLRDLVGFQPALAPELGYGKAVHHVLRTVAEHTKRHGRPPSPAQLDRLFDDDFFLPAANKPAHQQMKEAARRLVDVYVANHVDDLHRIWETERPFELHLDGVTVSGRADVILDKEGGEVSALAIVDYKTSADEGDDDLQLQVYADAGLREGLDVRAAYVHDLKASRRSAVDVSESGIQQGEQVVADLVERMRARDFTPSPGAACKRCDVRTICRSAI